MLDPVLIQMNPFCRRPLVALDYRASSYDILGNKSSSKSHENHILPKVEG